MSNIPSWRIFDDVYHFPKMAIPNIFGATCAILASTAKKTTESRVNMEKPNLGHSFLALFRKSSKPNNDAGPETKVTPRSISDTLNNEQESELRNEPEGVPLKTRAFEKAKSKRTFGVKRIKVINY